MELDKMVMIYKNDDKKNKHMIGNDLLSNQIVDLGACHNTC